MNPVFSDLLQERRHMISMSARQLVPGTPYIIQQNPNSAEELEYIGIFVRHEPGEPGRAYFNELSQVPQEFPPDSLVDFEPGLIRDRYFFDDRTLFFGRLPPLFGTLPPGDKGVRIAKIDHRKKTTFDKANIERFRRAMKELKKKGGKRSKRRRTSRKSRKSRKSRRGQQ